MNCRRSQDLLSAYLDRELDLAVADEVASHLAVCGECAEEYDALVQVTSVLRNVVPVSVPAGLWDALSQRIAAAPPRAVPVRRHQPALHGWALAAATILCASVWTPQAIHNADVGHLAPQMAATSPATNNTHPLPASPGISAASVQPGHGDFLTAIDSAATAHGRSAAPKVSQPVASVVAASALERAVPRSANVPGPASTATAVSPVTRVQAQPNPLPPAARIHSPAQVVQIAARPNRLEPRSRPEIGGQWEVPAPSSIPSATRSSVDTPVFLAPSATAPPSPDAAVSSDSSDDTAGIDGTVAMAANASAEAANLDQTGKDLLGMALEASASDPGPAGA